MPLTCHLMKVIHQLEQIKHNGIKSSIAMNARTKSRNFAEIIAEADELQRLFNSDLQNIIDQLSKAKSESSHPIHDLSEARGNNKHLNEELSKLQKEIDDLSFQDITDEITDIQQNENPQADKLSSINKSALQDTHNKSQEMKVVQPSNETMHVKSASESADMDTHS
ncbi:unnamed protein product [Mytilus coruscus]|uniref:Uncharacterized protein n=1 Tax=Mytilus coruscus TaxID=42192 RepID=A0A6J8D1A5_MYTCO|nr:unnamed protein product [Mytilus coruscus]